MWGQLTALPLLLLAAGILVITEAFSACNELNKWALDERILEGASENTIAANGRCWTDEERTGRAKPWHAFRNDVPSKETGIPGARMPSRMPSRAASTGFMYLSLSQKVPPGHQPKRWLPQAPGSKLEIDWFLSLLLSDLAVWDLFPHDSSSQALQRPALIFPVCKQQRFRKCQLSIFFF